ncbi:hypothetical protein [Methylobacterium sp. J-077]|nr:hypothetical protein [Methylobacterium sp. J-077]
MTDQSNPQSTASNDPPRIGEIRELFGVRLQWNGSRWVKVACP